MNRVSNVISISCSGYKLSKVEGLEPSPQIAPVY